MLPALAEQLLNPFRLHLGLRRRVMGAEYYQSRHREREINFLRRRAANLGFQIKQAVAS